MSYYNPLARPAIVFGSPSCLARVHPSFGHVLEYHGTPMMREEESDSEGELVEAEQVELSRPRPGYRKLFDTTEMPRVELLSVEQPAVEAAEVWEIGYGGVALGDKAVDEEHPTPAEVGEDTAHLAPTEGADPTDGDSLCSSESPASDNDRELHGPVQPSLQQLDHPSSRLVRSSPVTKPQTAEAIHPISPRATPVVPQKRPGSPLQADVARTKPNGDKSASLAHDVALLAGLHHANDPTARSCRRPWWKPYDPRTLLTPFDRDISTSRTGCQEAYSERRHSTGALRGPQSRTPRARTNTAGADFVVSELSKKGTRGDPIVIDEPEGQVQYFYPDVGSKKPCLVTITTSGHENESNITKTIKCEVSDRIAEIVNLAGEPERLDAPPVSGNELALIGSDKEVPLDGGPSSSTLTDNEIDEIGTSLVSVEKPSIIDTTESTKCSDIEHKRSSRSEFVTEDEPAINDGNQDNIEIRSDNTTGLDNSRLRPSDTVSANDNRLTIADASNDCVSATTVKHTMSPSNPTRGMTSSKFTPLAKAVLNGHALRTCSVFKSRKKKGTRNANYKPGASVTSAKQHSGFTGPCSSMSLSNTPTFGQGRKSADGTASNQSIVPQNSTPFQLKSCPAEMQILQSGWPKSVLTQHCQPSPIVFAAQHITVPAQLNPFYFEASTLNTRTPSTLQSSSSSVQAHRLHSTCSSSRSAPIHQPSKNQQPLVAQPLCQDKRPSKFQKNFITCPETSQPVLLHGKRETSSTTVPPTTGIASVEDHMDDNNSKSRSKEREAKQRKDDRQLQVFRSLLETGLAENNAENAFLEEINMTPLFTWSFAQAAKAINDTVFPQFGLLGHVVADQPGRSVSKAEIDPVLVNTNSPFSVFLCGSQGSGKSHTMSCLLESCLYQDSHINVLPQALSGMVFHYDKLLGESIAQPAYLASHVKVRVLVAPSNYDRMQSAYARLGFSNNITVEPLYFQPKHLNTERIKRLMAVDTGSSMPLYLHTLVNILRKMALESGGKNEFDWTKFKYLLNAEPLTDAQKAPLTLRIDLIEGFMKHANDTAKPLPPTGPKGNQKSRKPKLSAASIVHGGRDLFAGEPGVLTVVDLTDPVIDPETACVLFDICLALFVERTTCGKVIALDEAHNYMETRSEASALFTQTIMKNVREQRHKAVRVIVATQEPSINPALLDLCSITIVHRFTSPDWYATIRQHLAAVQFGEDEIVGSSDEEGAAQPGADRKQLMRKILKLKVGESLLFCPPAAMRFDVDGEIGRLHEGYLHFKTRPRITTDGGKSKMAVRA